MPLTLGDIMTKKLVTIRSDTPLEEALEILRLRRIRHLLVTDEITGRLLGLLSDRDIKKYVSPFAGSRIASPQDNATLRVKAGAVMRRELITARPEETVKSMVERMLQRKLSCLPIVEEKGRVIGIVTTDDLLRALLKYL